MLVCAFFRTFCTRDRGCSVHPVFPAPSCCEGKAFFQQTSGEVRRENAKLCLDLPLRGAKRRPRPSKLNEGRRKRSTATTPRYGLLRGVCRWAALCADPLARNDGVEVPQVHPAPHNATK